WPRRSGWSRAGRPGWPARRRGSAPRRRRRSPAPDRASASALLQFTCGGGRRSVRCGYNGRSPMRLAPIILFVCAAAAHAQTPLGAVTGLATDPSGAAVPGAAIRLTNDATGVKRESSTNGAGAYSFPDLPPGSYRLNADAKGFRAIETRSFAIEAHRSVRQD